MGALDAFLIIGAIGVPTVAYIGNLGGFRDWINSGFGQPVAAQPGGGGGGADTCNKISTGPSGFRYQCGCAGSAPFNMGPQYSQLPSQQACSACKVECNKRRATAAGAGMGYAQSFASFPIKGLIVA